jgi:predicted nucleotide-binding protein with TIR-like domain
MDKLESLKLLEELIEQAKNLTYGDEQARDLLRRRSKMILEGILGAENKYLRNLVSIMFYPNYGLTVEPEKIRAWESGKEKMVNLFSTVIEELTLFEPQSPVSAVPRIAPEGGRKVFVVHGHDENLKEMVENLLNKLELEPIILHKLPNKGRTIIEKFEEHSDVSFAIVLLTPDDMAYARVDDPKAARPRARQNVILELGFFLGRLSRERVAALHRGDETFEIPSDYSGILFIKVDTGGAWRFELIKELKASGIAVDANKVV